MGVTHNFNGLCRQLGLFGLRQPACARMHACKVCTSPLIYPIAAAMRHEVRKRVIAGQSDTQITDWLVERYGDYVNFAPPASGSGLLLWIAPLLLLGFALLLARGRFGKNGS